MNRIFFFSWIQRPLFILLLLPLLYACSASEEAIQPWQLEPPVHTAIESTPPTTPLDEETAASPLTSTPEERLQPPRIKPLTSLTPAGDKRQVAQAAPQPRLMTGWEPVITRLVNDGHDPKTVQLFFQGIADYAPHPMVTKVEELYRSHFIRKKSPPPDPNAPRPSRYRIYKGFVTKETIARCKSFLHSNRPYFKTMEERYGVPQEIIVALLFVETKLGTFMGKENALWSLASMANSATPEQMKEHLSRLPLTSEHDSWLQSKLTEKSNWAYKELCALISHCQNNQLDPATMPGSVYGAIGICQFMPSNLGPYSADGDDNGIIDIFTPADAIHSAAKFLKSHGWRPGISIESQRTVIKKYNNLTVYANTILALAESLKTGQLYSAAPDAPTGQPKLSQKAQPPQTAKKASPPKKGSKSKTPQKSVRPTRKPGIPQKPSRATLP